jgi:hypothetical protein
VTEALIDFLIDIATNPIREASFWENPADELEHLDLTDHERHVLLTRDSSRLRELLADDKRHSNHDRHAAKHGGSRKGGALRGARKAGKSAGRKRSGPARRKK